MSEAQQAKVLEACKGSPQPLSGSEVAAKTGLKLESVMKAVNVLLNTGGIEMLQVTRDGKPAAVFRCGTAVSAQLAQLSVDDKLIYQIIEASSNKGIWLRDIRARSGFELRRTHKSIKELTRRNLIKAVTSVVASKKKLYMLASLEPDESLTGGAWYADDDFDADFVDVLRRIALKFFRDRAAKLDEDEAMTALQRYRGSFASASEVHSYIERTGISEQSLAPRDVEKMLETLVHAGSLAAASPSGERKYRLRKSAAASMSVGLLSAPCLYCPVAHVCREDGLVNPRDCPHLQFEL